MRNRNKNKNASVEEDTLKHQNDDVLSEEERVSVSSETDEGERVDFFSNLFDEVPSTNGEEEIVGVSPEKSLEEPNEDIEESKDSDDDFLDLFDDVESEAWSVEKSNVSDENHDVSGKQEKIIGESKSKKSKSKSFQLRNKFDGLRKLSDVFKTRKGKYIILGSCMAAMAIMVSVSALIMYNTNKVETRNKANTKEKYLSSALETDEKVDLSSGVLGWCNAVLCDDFETCDAITGAGRYGTLGYQYEVTSNDVSSAVYDMMLTKVSESISTIKVMDREELENGSVVYSLGVSYRPYNDITGISIDTDKLQSLCDDYIRNKYDADEFKKEVQELYQDWFKSCFTKQDKDYLVTIKLVQQENEDGSISVQNTNTAFTELLNITGVSDIEKVYETNLINEIAPVMSIYN